MTEPGLNSRGSTLFKKLTQRQIALEEQATREAKINADHRDNDVKSFAEVKAAISSNGDELRKAIVTMGGNLEAKIENLQHELRSGLSDVAQLKSDKLKSDAFTEGFKSAKQPNPWVLQIAPVIVATALAALGSWIAHDYYAPNNEQKSIVTSTTVEHGK